MSERYITESDDPISDAYRNDNLMQAYKHITDMLTSDSPEDSSVLEVGDILASEFDDFLIKLVVDKSFPNRIDIFSTQVDSPEDITEIYTSMSILPEELPTSQKVLFLESGEKVITIIPTDLGKDEGQNLLSVRIGQLEGMVDFIQDLYSNLNKNTSLPKENPVETTKKTENILLRKSLERVFRDPNITREILMTLGESDLKDLDGYIRDFSEDNNEKNPKNKIDLRVGEVEGVHHFSIILNDLRIAGGYLPEEEKVSIYCMKSGEVSYVLFPYLDENLKLHIYGRSLGSAGYYIKGIWEKQFKKK